MRGGMTPPVAAQPPTFPASTGERLQASHSEYVDHGPCPPIPGPEVEDPDDPLLVGTALIVMVVLPDVAPAAIVVGLAAHVAPVSICGSVHVIVIVEGKGAFPEYL